MINHACFPVVEVFRDDGIYSGYVFIQRPTFLVIPSFYFYYKYGHENSLGGRTWKGEKIASLNLPEVHSYNEETLLSLYLYLTNIKHYPR